MNFHTKLKGSLSSRCSDFQIKKCRAYVALEEKTRGSTKSVWLIIRETWNSRCNLSTTFFSNNSSLIPLCFGRVFSLQRVNSQQCFPHWLLSIIRMLYVIVGKHLCLHLSKLNSRDVKLQHSSETATNGFYFTFRTWMNSMQKEMFWHCF